jgi:lysozyme family protein
VDHANDPGGATNYGVSLRFLRNEGIDIGGDGDIDEADVLAISPEKSGGIYKEKFWEPCHCEEIRSVAIATKVFDMAVNMGQRQAYKLVQRAINEASSKNLTVDGIVGKKTLSAINKLEKEDFRLLDAIRKQQADFYENLIESKPDLSAFRLGWLRRAAA